ncbi:hypothetical protein IFM89_038069, partial [Coptis chinensis]
MYRVQKCNALEQIEDYEYSCYNPIVFDLANHFCEMAALSFKTPHVLDYDKYPNEDERKAKRALVVLCDLHHRRVWFDERTANVISTACFHSSSSLPFLLGFERIEEGDGSDDSGDEDDMTPQNPQVIISREARYK